MNNIGEPIVINARIFAINANFLIILSFDH